MDPFGSLIGPQVYLTTKILLDLRVVSCMSIRYFPSKKLVFARFGEWHLGVRENNMDQTELLYTFCVAVYDRLTILNIFISPIIVDTINRISEKKIKEERLTKP